MLATDEIFGGGNEIVVAGFHSLFGERTGVFNSLLSHLAPSRLLGGIVLIGRPRVHHSARLDLLAEITEVLLRKVVIHFRLFFRIEVVEVAEELVESRDWSAAYGSGRRDDSYRTVRSHIPDFAALRRNVNW
jgi:hypothetical protein